MLISALSAIGNVRRILSVILAINGIGKTVGVPPPKKIVSIVSLSGACSDISVSNASEYAHISSFLRPAYELKSQ